MSVVLLSLGVRCAAAINDVLAGDGGGRSGGRRAKLSVFDACEANTARAGEQYTMSPAVCRLRSYREILSCA